MVYFVRNNQNGRFLVRRSINPEQRLSALRREFGNDVEIVAAFWGGSKLERFVRVQIESQRRDDNWYDPHQKINAIIKKLETPEFEILDGRAYAVLRRDEEGAATDPCPFCGEPHFHGAGDGHRVAHCSSRKSVEAVQVDGKSLSQSDGYLVRTGR